MTIFTSFQAKKNFKNRMKIEWFMYKYKFYYKTPAKNLILVLFMSFFDFKWIVSFMIHGHFTSLCIIQSIFVQSSKFFFCLKACENRQLFKIIRTFSTCFTNSARPVYLFFEWKSHKNMHYFGIRFTKILNFIDLLIRWICLIVHVALQMDIT